MAKKRKHTPAPKGINLIVFALLCFVMMFLGMDLGLHRGTSPQTPALRAHSELFVGSPAEVRVADDPRFIVF